MKKLTKILLLCALVLCLVGSVLLAIGITAGGIDDLIGDRYTYTQEKTALADIRAIDADLDTISLTIQPSDDDHCYLEYHFVSLDDHNPLDVSIDDGRLTLRENAAWTQSGDNHIGFYAIDLFDFPDFLFNSRQSHAFNIEANGEDGAGSFFNDLYTTNSATLYLPQTLLDSVQVDLALGTLTITDLQTTTLDALLNLGSINLKGVTAAVCTAELNMGELTIEQSQLDNNTLTLNMGDLTLRQTQLGSGRIGLDMGSLEAASLALTGDLTIDASMGDIDLRLTPDTLATTAINTTVDAGDSHTPQTPPTTPTQTLTITASMGDVTVE